MTQNIIIHQAGENDIPALAKMHVEGGRMSYQGLVDQAYLDSLTVAQFEQNWRGWMAEDITTVLAEDDGSPCGFCSYGKLKTPPPGSSPIRPAYTAEIYAIYVLADYWRRGIGTALLKQAAGDLHMMGHKSMCLWVLKGNDRAGAFYEKLGGSRVGKHQIQVGPSKVLEMCYGWRNLSFLL